jgi:hypothetical protein
MEEKGNVKKKIEGKKKGREPSPLSPHYD